MTMTTKPTDDLEAKLRELLPTLCSGWTDETTRDLCGQVNELGEVDYCDPCAQRRAVANFIRECEAGLQESATEVEHDRWTKAFFDAGLFFGDEASSPEAVIAVLKRREAEKDAEIVKLRDQLEKPCKGCGL